jgi:predicted nucleotidyltransferase
MPRDDVRIYCNKHIPKGDVVIHKLIEDESYYAEEIFPQKKKKAKFIERRAGWKMGVRYLKRPPKEYGYTAVTPNVCCEHIAKRVTKLKKSYWTTEWIRKDYNSEIKAVRETIKMASPLSPVQQTWRRYLLKLKGRKALKKLNLPFNVLKEIKIVSQRLKRRYKDLLGVLLIGSFAEGTYQKDSDIDIVFIKEKRTKYYRDLDKLTKDAKKEIQLIPFSMKDVNQHFKDSTTMAYALQRGKIIYEKKDSLERFCAQSLGWPSKEWMKNWFEHWLKIYDFGVRDFKKSRRKKFDFVSDYLPRAVVNFGTLFLETKGYIPTTKRDLGNCFYKEIHDGKAKEGFKIALESHHEDRDISLKEAEKVYLSGEFLKKQINKYFEELKEREKRWKGFLKRK